MEFFDEKGIMHQGRFVLPRVVCKFIMVACLPFLLKNFAYSKKKKKY